MRDDIAVRLADSVETALKLADGLVIAENAESGEQTLYSEKFACPVSGFTIPRSNPSVSFNSPHGACRIVTVWGKSYVDPELVVPDPSKSIRKGAVDPWSGGFAPFLHASHGSRRQPLRL